MLRPVRTACRSIVVRLVLFGVALVLAGFVLRMAYLIPYLRDRLIDLSSEHQLTIANYVARDIDAKLQARLTFLDHLATALPADLLTDPARLEDWLKERHQTNPIFSYGLAVIPADGHGAWADWPIIPGRRGLDYSGTGYLIDALAVGRPVIGAPMRGRASGEPVLVAAAPIRDREGRPVAVITGVTTLAAPGFLDILQETKIGHTGGFLLISPKDGVFVAATDRTKILTPLPPPGRNPLHDRAMAGYRGTGITVNIHGVEELSAMASVPTADWFLVARVPTLEALEALETFKDFVIRGTIVVTLTLIVVGGLMIRALFKPLLTSSHLMHRMASGEIELQPLPVARRDEIGDLALGFNFLLARLDEVTGQKLAAERLRLAEKEHMEGLLRQWMADVSHELRTPTSILQAQIEAIQDGVFEADARRMDLLHGEVMGMSRLVEDLFVLARSDINKLEIRADEVDLCALVDDAVHAFRGRYAEAGLTIDWHGCDDGHDGHVVRGDAARLRQVVSNLLENTLRYTDAGGRLAIACGPGESGLTLTFDDTPPGVPPEMLPRLFERFFRVDGSRSRRSGGSGIGLALCRSLAEAHGGSITAEASPLGGLRVLVHLPRAEECR
jgi:signal transduction histidine kinase